MRADDGHRLEVVDNVSLAPRVPVTPGDRVSIQGVLVPDARRGPLVHWTHHDPRATILMVSLFYGDRCMRERGFLVRRLHQLGIVTKR